MCISIIVHRKSRHSFQYDKRFKKKMLRKRNNSILWFEISLTRKKIRTLLYPFRTLYFLPLALHLQRS